METTDTVRQLLGNGYAAAIAADPAQLDIFTPAGEFVGSIAAPEFSTFYTFAEHIKHGNCPVVSFSSSHTHQGWPDWYCKVDIKSQSLTLLNPWR